MAACVSPLFASDTPSANQLTAEMFAEANNSTAAPSIASCSIFNWWSAGLSLLFWQQSSAAPQQPSAESCVCPAIELRDSGKQVEALREFRRAARLNPKLRYVQREIGLILLERRDFAAAASEFQIAAQQDPQDRESRYNFALSLANAGQRQRGLKELRAFCSGRLTGVSPGLVWDTSTRWWVAM